MSFPKRAYKVFTNREPRMAPVFGWQFKKARAMPDGSFEMIGTIDTMFGTFKMAQAKQRELSKRYAPPMTVALIQV